MSLVKGNKRNGGALTIDSLIQQKTMNAYIESQVQGLRAEHTHWMYQNKLEMRFEGDMLNVHSKESWPRNALRVKEVMGAYTFPERRRTRGTTWWRARVSTARSGMPALPRRDDRHCQSGSCQTHSPQQDLGEVIS